ncbi:TetR/AcrR family transcriptional regulator [Silvibacterium sp.]|uniref:TetR/AcrR family transcriptional regulator n=1 Tax=Silvibacterium sp. TaxID=1964179 RepID=UPI0039E34858
MSTPTKPLLKPRKSPVQARSTASVDAILEATLQVLLREGREGLTTTRVAMRAGVSVGSLYQYFPNKSSLLQAVLRAHLERTYGATVAAGEKYRGLPLRAMGKGLLADFLAMKFEHIEASLALYQISDDVEGAKIARAIGQQSVAAVAAMLRSSCEPLTTDATSVASMILAAIAGVSRRMLESEDPHTARQELERELRVMVMAYLDALKA